MFAVLGPVVSAVFVSTIGLAPTFGVLVLLLVIGGIGSAAFHPPGASYAVRVADGRGGGARYSVFAFGGSIGFALGPLIAVGLAQSRGLEGLWVAMIPALAIAPFVYLALPSGRSERLDSRRSAPPSLQVVVRHLRGPLGILFGVSAIMAFVQRAFLTMEPIIVAEGGGSEALGALALSAYLGAQAFGIVAGGLLADRMDRARLIAALCLLVVPTHLLAVWVGPGSAFGLFTVVMAGTLGMATLPPIVVMAQELVPSGAAVSSGIVMGLAWATGALAVLGTGMLADVVGARMATLASVPVALLAVALALHPTLRGGGSGGGGGADSATLVAAGGD